jgi:AcrR family transcriptional regulator
MTYNRRKDARPGEILDAALEAFAENSFAKTNMAAIAKRAGVSRPTLYLYFASKEEIFEALIREKVAPLIKHRSAASYRDVNAKQQLEMLLRSILGQITGPSVSPLLRLLIAEGPQFPAMTKTYKSQLVDPGQQVLRHLIEQGVAEGSLGQHALKLDPKVLVAPGLMSVVWTSLFGEVDPIDMETMIDAYLATLMRGLGARPEE